MRILNQPAPWRGHAGTIEPGEAVNVFKLQYVLTAIVNPYLFLGPAKLLGNSPQTGLAHSLLHEVLVASRIRVLLSIGSGPVSRSQAIGQLYASLCSWHDGQNRGTATLFVQRLQGLADREVLWLRDDSSG